MEKTVEKTMHEIYEEHAAREADELVRFPCEEEAQQPVYYVKCTHFWPEFKENEQFPYCEVHVCDWSRMTEAASQEEADEEAARMNREGFVCPLCGQAGRLKGASQFELYNDRRILASINRSEIQHG